MATQDRNLGVAHLLMTLIGVQLKMSFRARKTWALAVVQLLPVIGAFIYVIFENVDGMTMFTGITEKVTLTFLVPLAAIFFGGPAIVDEMEGRTLTYLTLRPLPKPMILIGKVAAGSIIACVLTIIPVVALFGICATQADPAELMGAFGKAAGAVVIGTIAYTTTFAALGAAFASTLLASIVYFVVFEMVLATLPILELLSVRYYMRTFGGFSATDRLGMLDSLVLQEPIVFDWWIGGLVLVGLSVAALIAGASIFANRQYHV
jgi:ABC-type transport system involved in multi-copper enzyme maturation permease subunit